MPYLSQHNFYIGMSLLGHLVGREIGGQLQLCRTLVDAADTRVTIRAPPSRRAQGAKQPTLLPCLVVFAARLIIVRKKRTNGKWWSPPRDIISATAWQ